ncbi:threonyl-tRNA synthetase [Colletotrichum phormii]|uniref:threonine--tRNA ligase n=1 Tax=Colletotrichum phormii TaxID=359342 RepID=A0AAI9ZQI5_9PEZI|nr:threonyl-tRNA synthetase [Colletotrichum phormii]KAK1636000.1 threonyl-tRNA synthetase [Colletotrichum phormii]
MLPARSLRPASRAVPILLRSPAAALRPQCLPRRWYADKKAAPPPPPSQPPAAAAEDDLPDHRKLGVQQELFTSSVYSPGSPIFLPNGTRIFNRLVDFLRRQYVHYGFDEVITPNIYKKSLWEVSGHLQNYADDMYTVTSRARAPEEKMSCCGGSHGDQPHEGASGEQAARQAEGEDDDYGLKPMNCPGHCLIFASKNRSYRDLPIRYADFSPLHRNEISGALSGLTRVRRFHQDDGHVFCRPIQIQEEVFKTLDFMKTVYGALGLEQFDFALSTRPADHYIGTDAEWARAESQLRDALEQAGLKYTVKEGDGAFYGPKIDVMLHDSHGKSHQAGTIQLDFQLPQRFNLEYQAPAPALEAQGLPLDGANVSAADLETYGPVPPVMIHRAILGSVERLMALLIEEYKGRWPFWLNPRQCVILAINDTEPVMSWASEVKDILTGHDRVRDPANPRQPRPTGFAVEIDASARSLAKKLKEAREKQPGFILVVGKGDVAAKQVTVEATDGPGSSGGTSKGSRQQMNPLALLEKMQEKVATYQ